jgi:PAS domain S-box-containing protein
MKTAVDAFNDALDRANWRSMVMLSAKQFLLSGYSIAVIASLLTLLLRLLLVPILNGNAPLLVFILPVLFSAWYGGLRSGLLATVLCAVLGTYFFVLPTFSLTVTDLANGARVAIFVAEGICISVLSGALRNAKNRAEQVASRLRDSEEQYRLLVEGVKDYAIFGLDPQGRITSWNNGAELIQGYTAAEALGRPISLFYTEADLEQGKPDRNLRIAATEERVEDRGWRKRKDGSLFWADVVTTALRDEQGQLRGFSKVIRDITQQKRSEEALQESYGLLQTVIEGTGDAIFVKDRQGRYKLANSATARILGKPKAEILGKDDTELLPLAVALVTQQLDRTVMETGMSQTFEEEIPEADGLRTFLTTKDPYRDGQGNITGVIGIARDITERKQAEAALRRSAQRLETLQQIDRAILQVTSPNKIAETALLRLKQTIAYQQSMVVLFNFETNEAYVLAGQVDSQPAGSVLPIETLSPPADLRYREGIRYIEDLGTMQPRPPLLERLFIQGTRSIIIVALVVENELIGDLYLLSNQPAAFNQESQDIAQEVANQLAIVIQQAQLREQLQRYAEELEQRVAKRTAQLQETNQELEAFTYSVSHDLRAPLRTVQGFAQALLEDCGEQLEDFCRSYIDSIIGDAIQMNGLISDLLNYSRLTRAQISLQPTALDSVIEEALKQLTTQIQETQAQISIAAPLPQVIAHRPTLVQTVTNLIGNALKFVEDKTRPQIDIFTEETYQNDHRWIRLWIVDNGIGIAPEHQERIFRVFERLHGAESYPGTGIGLAIVRKGLERMGGQVGVESQLGHGSRFWIALPSAVLPLDSLTHDTTSPNSFN